MSLGEILAVSGGGIVLLLCLIQVSPIKWNPWAALGRAIGRTINAELIDKVDKLAKEVDGNERDRIRYEILRFAASCRAKERHSQEEFHHIFELNDKYHEILQRNKEQNGLFEQNMAFIKDTYRGRLQNNDFIT